VYIFSQVLVCIADLSFVFSMLSKSKLKLTIFLLGSDVLFSTHYLLLGAYTGSIIVFIDAAFLIVAFLLQNYNKDNFVSLACFTASVCVTIATILTWSGAISLLPMFAILSYLFAMNFKNLIIVKVGTTIRNVFNIVYVFLIGSYVGALLECCLLINSIVGTILTIKQTKNEQKSSKITID